MRNPNLGIPALEDGLFGEFVDFQWLLSFWKSEWSERPERSERSKPWEVSHLFSREIHVECRQHHVWGPPGTRVMSIFIKTYSLVKVREGKGREGREIVRCIPYTFIYLYILYIPLYALIYIKISNIRKIRSDLRLQNGHKSGPRASPMARIWHAPSYHTLKDFSCPKGVKIN